MSYAASSKYAVVCDETGDVNKINHALCNLDTRNGPTAATTTLSSPRVTLFSH